MPTNPGQRAAQQPDANEQPSAARAERSDAHPSTTRSVNRRGAASAQGGGTPHADATLDRREDERASGRHRGWREFARPVALSAIAAILINWVAVALTQSLPVGGWKVRALHYLYDAGYHLAAAAAVLAVFGLLRLLKLTHSRLTYAIALGLLWLVLGAALWSDVSAFVQRHAGARWEAPVKVVLCGSLALGLVSAALAVPRLARPWGPVAAVLLGVSVLFANHLVLPNDYPGIHLLLTIAGTILLAAAMAAGLPRWRWRHAAWAAALPAAGVSAFAVAVKPSQTVLVEMLRAEGSALTPFLVQVHAGAALDAEPIFRAPEWFMDRSQLPAIPHSTPNPVPESPIVLFITIDSLRADLLTRPETRRALPTLTRLAERSVYFTQARAPGSQTVYTLTSVFAGTYFSQQYWSTGAPDRSTRATDSLFPHATNSIRFPTSLHHAGISTVTFASSSWLVNSVGVVRGFSQERFVRSRGEKYTHGRDLTRAALRHLKEVERGPLFLYLHYLDPHSPYNRGKRTQGPPFERYLDEVRLVDAELARLIHALRENGAWSKTVLILSADHGEAFGEHGSRYHATTLYDEQTRVPLLIRVPGVQARQVDVPVSLMDIGPTVLDVFGLPTPATFMGQSLLGFIRGEDPHLTRPIVAEGRLKKSWVFEDGFKLIVDDRNGALELYNLNVDPGETVNVFDTEPTANARLATLRTFFDVHRIRRAGYEIPYRP